MTRVLITGFSSPRAADLALLFLDRGDHVTAVTRSRDSFDPAPFSKFSKTFDVFTGSLLDAGLKLPKADIILHLAAITPPFNPQAQPEDYRAFNVEGTRALVKHGENTGTRLFVFFSTMAVYGQGPSTGLVTDSSPVSPQNAYAESKLASEKICQESRLRSLVLRVPGFTSVGDLKHPWLAGIVRKLLLNERIEYFGPEQPFNNITDSKEVFRQLLFHDEKMKSQSRTLNMCGRDPICVKPLLFSLKERLGSSSELVQGTQFMPMYSIDPAGLLNHGLEGELTQAMIDRFVQGVLDRRQELGPKSRSGLTRGWELLLASS